MGGFIWWSGRLRRCSPGVLTVLVSPHTCLLSVLSATSIRTSPFLWLRLRLWYLRVDRNPVRSFSPSKLHIPAEAQRDRSTPAGRAGLRTGWLTGRP